MPKYHHYLLNTSSWADLFKVMVKLGTLRIIVAHTTIILYPYQDKLKQIAAGKTTSQLTKCLNILEFLNNHWTEYVKLIEQDPSIFISHGIAICPTLALNSMTGAQRADTASPENLQNKRKLVSSKKSVHCLKACKKNSNRLLEVLLSKGWGF